MATDLNIPKELESLPIAFQQFMEIDMIVINGKKFAPQ
jgi:hypothetical protein